ncbi:MAG: hypothetical protein R2838_21235 [Caldilineaceae bacterium]
MAKDRSLVRASDIGAWAFCQRAWWLANVQGAEHTGCGCAHPRHGRHRIHGETVRQVHSMQRLGLILLGLGGLPLLVLAVLFWVLFG